MPIQFAEHPTSTPKACARPHPVRISPGAGGPRVLSLWGKGGAGKSTTCIQLAGVGASIGHRVLILDTDPQNSIGAWRKLRHDSSIAVSTCRPEEVDRYTERAGGLGFDLVVVDNAPVRTGCSDAIAALTDLSMIMVRPSMLDLVVAVDWINWLNANRRRFVVVIGGAPPMRNGVEAPFVRQARAALREEASRVWKHQITLRHAVIESVGIGKTVMEAEPASPAAAEFCRLWTGVMNELEKV